MSFLSPKYPNLELIEYKVKHMLSQNEEFMQKVTELKEEKHVYHACVSFSAIVFPQMWGSTCTGFDVTGDGAPAIGGCAMTREYTTVMHESLTDTYVVCFGDRPCYKVTNANEAFLKDLDSRDMASLSVAMKRY